MEPKKKRRKNLKQLTYILIDRSLPAGDEMYEMLRQLVTDHHESLRDARIALAWNRTWKPDVDGRVTLGKCKRASDLDRELAAYDFVIILNQGFWEDGDVEDSQRLALMDHELCHAEVKLDEAGEPIEDERGRKVYRTRKHDIEEFSEIVRRHGVYKHDLERFAVALAVGKARQLSLLGDAADKYEKAYVETRAARDPRVQAAIEGMRPKPGSGIESVTFSDSEGGSVTLHAKDTH